MVKKLIKTDKNGTKHFMDTVKCGKCGGTGFIEYFAYHDGGICYECGGTGFKTEIVKEYTPEYQAKLDERRKKREDIRIAQIIESVPIANQKYLKRNGFNSEGITYIFIGNTYDIKDQLKSGGAIFDNTLGWHAPNKIENFPFVTLNIEDYADTDIYGNYVLVNCNVYAKVNMLKKEAEANINKADSTSEFVGNIGDRIELKLKLINYHYYSYEVNEYTSYSYFIYTFSDENGNIFVWKASNEIWEKTDVNKVVNIKGTIKDHTEYKGIKQTLLTRCKFISFEN